MSRLSAVSTLAALVAADCSGAKRGDFPCAIHTPVFLGWCTGSRSFYRQQKITATHEISGGEKKISKIMEPLLLFLVFCKCASTPAFRTEVAI